MAVELSCKIMGMNVKPQHPRIMEDIDKTICPECQEQTMVEVGGCSSCKQCGWSKCG